jgi:hypothetical protein
MNRLPVVILKRIINTFWMWHWIAFQLTDIILIKSSYHTFAGRQCHTPHKRHWLSMALLRHEVKKWHFAWTIHSTCCATVKQFSQKWLPVNCTVCFHFRRNLLSKLQLYHMNWALITHLPSQQYQNSYIWTVILIRLHVKCIQFIEHQIFNRKSNLLVLV